MIHATTGRRALPFVLRIAHVSDLHVTEGPRLDDQRDTLARILAGIREQRPHLIVVTGDLYGHTVPHRSTPRERQVLYPWIQALAALAPVFVLYGNHDARPDLDVLALLAPGRVTVLDGAGAHSVCVGEMGAALTVRLAWVAYPTTGWLLADREAVAVERGRIEAGLALSRWLRAQAAAVQAAPDVAHVLLGHVMVGGSLTSGGEVLAGQEIEVSPSDLAAVGADYVALGHLHRAQEVAPGAWYAGSPWRTDFGDVDARKGWLDVEAAGNAVGVELRDSGARAFHTIEYEWRDGRIECVSDADLASGPLRGAEVKARLTVRADAVNDARPAFADEVASIRAIAHRVVVEVVAEPVVRVRAPELAQATTLEERLRVVWDQSSPPPPEEDRRAALSCLAQLAADLGGAA